MIIVLDTNALIQVFGARSPFLPLQQAILDGRVTLAFSNAILFEYEEVLTRYGGPQRWPRQALQMTGQLHDNLRHVEPTYHWRLSLRLNSPQRHHVDCMSRSHGEAVQFRSLDRRLWK